MLVLAMALAALVGCGGGGGDSSSSSSPNSGVRPEPLDPHTATSGPPADTRHADAAAVRTIRGWVNAERLSEIDHAATFFSLPALVLNGGGPELLRSRDDVRQWIGGLPCGAALLRAVDVRGWTIARFRLTDRSGGHCDGPGGSASTAFALREGKIAMWIRVRDDVPPEKAAPQRPPDRDFIRHGRVGGRPVPAPAVQDSPNLSPAA
jgi:hypothetical protein